MRRAASPQPSWRNRAASGRRHPTSSTRTTSRVGDRRSAPAGPDVTMAMIDAFLAKMYRANPDFVFTVSRDFVRACKTPVLVLPDDVPAHPFACAMESALLAPNSEVRLYPWKEPAERVPLAVRHIRSFFRAHCPATAAR